MWDMEDRHVYVYEHLRNVTTLKRCPQFSEVTYYKHNTKRAAAMQPRSHAQGRQMSGPQHHAVHAKRMHGHKHSEAVRTYPGRAGRDTNRDTSATIGRSMRETPDSPKTADTRTRACTYAKTAWGMSHVGHGGQTCVCMYTNTSEPSSKRGPSGEREDRSREEVPLVSQATR